MELRLQLVSVAGSILLLGVVFEFVRRKRLRESYALLWLFSAFVLLLLAAWRDLLSQVADTVGIFYPPSALFMVAFAFVLVLLLHFSLAVSRLTDQSKVLAQRMALLEERQRESELASAQDETGRESHGNGEPRVASSSRTTRAQ